MTHSIFWEGVVTGLQPAIRPPSRRGAGEWKPEDCMWNGEAESGKDRVEKIEWKTSSRKRKSYNGKGKAPKSKKKSAEQKSKEWKRKSQDKKQVRSQVCRAKVCRAPKSKKKSKNEDKGICERNKNKSGIYNNIRNNNNGMSI